MSIKNAFNVSFERIWFLDAYGHVLCYAPYYKGLARVPILGMLLKGFVALPYPLPISSVPTWWGSAGSPLEVPEFLLERTSDDFVTLRKKLTGEYLSIDVHNNKTPLVVGLNGWERFLPITHDMFQGLVLMTNPDIGEVRLASTGQRVRELVFPVGGASEFHTALLGDARIDLKESRAAFAALGRLGVNETVTLSLPLYEGKGHCIITATRLQPIVGEG
ncbi:hypothetical protein [Bombella sp. ESL0385]|uniref:hypothetical protein n=1 Tax=Bombella sp. ESL0385 TaxID=2676446 RepID=UPI0012D90CA3|nr:hypothetical protein [Bombella sp. ESL0385]MUG90440.1 hypothetical protein [Bombella sp. ESL0385]